jgi:8-oxo-dGTP pyrophosphatase MutT (NUDIX family)
MSDSDEALKREMQSTASKATAEQQAIKPLDAATLIIVDTAQSSPRVLMGKRRPDLAFMANKYVFPGGRVDQTDKGVIAADELRADEVRKLLVDMKGTPSAARARALALAAVREAYEEAGLVIGTRAAAPKDEIPENWRAFFELGYQPSLAALTLVARAITPPGRPRRFDTRFFAMRAEAIAERCDISDGELSGLEWLTLDAARELDLPHITRVVIEDLQDRLERGALEASEHPVPFYYMKGGSFQRHLIRADDPV